MGNHGDGPRPLLDRIIGAGGHVAIGRGDCHYTPPRALTDPEPLLAVCDRAAALGREVATPDEARAMLQIA